MVNIMTENIFYDPLTVVTTRVPKRVKEWLVDCAKEIDIGSGTCVRNILVRMYKLWQETNGQDPTLKKLIYGEKNKEKE